ncbi:hypothetical protein KC19_2G162700 [Ceratodon purpureus]|uniref:Uncharacterized protein n=1 Tax=Ceratodon purpureus TaxID=3225 RepID=A0A8T0IW79_CERPU|nr:hypothetical protein KC19_2G162700 [Ceratodon purpureus]
MVTENRRTHTTNCKKHKIEVLRSESSFVSLVKPQIFGSRAPHGIPHIRNPYSNSKSKTICHQSESHASLPNCFIARSRRGVHLAQANNSPPESVIYESSYAYCTNSDIFHFSQSSHLSYTMQTCQTPILSED